jgi:hypothetical protein
MIGAMAAFTTACSSDDHDDITVLSSNSALKIAFVKTDTGHIENNLQAGDVLTYKYTLEGIDGDYSSYEIVPEGQTVVFHQIKDTDFSLVGSPIIKPIGKEGNFQLKILKPGNFQLKFVLKKVTSEGGKTTAATAEANFNAVKITAYRYNWQYKKTSMYTVYAYFHKLYIDTGHEQYDNLYLGGLSMEVSFKNSKNLNDAFNNPFQDFIPNTHIDFYEYQLYGNGLKGLSSSPGVVVATIDKIKFVKDVNGVNTFMEYDNIPVIDRGRQDSWEGNGDMALN